MQIGQKSRRLSGLGTDYTGTITGGGGTGSALPPCTSAQATDPTYMNTADGSIRSNGQGVTCDPNAIPAMSQGDATDYLQSLLYGIQNTLSTPATQQSLIPGLSNTILFAAGIGVLLVIGIASGSSSGGRRRR